MTFAGGDGRTGTVVILKNWKAGSYVSLLWFHEHAS